MYTYLTGSASWYLLTLVTQAFGVRGQFGDLVLEPKLVAEQFDQNGKARLITRFADRELEIIYFNQARLDYGDYQIHAVSLDGRSQSNLPGYQSSFPAVGFHHWTLARPIGLKLNCQ